MGHKPGRFTACLNRRSRDENILRATYVPDPQTKSLCCAHPLSSNATSTVRECPDHEDNLILDLAAEVGAMLIVSNDSDLLSMSPWRGTPILMPTAFAAKVDAMRRHRRRRNR